MVNVTTTNSFSGTKIVSDLGASSTVHARIPVYFFLDFSNIAISASQLAAKNGDGFYSDHRIRLHCDNLRALAERGRQWQSGFAAAGFSNPQSNIKQHFDRAGIKMHLSERGLSTRREQNVDQLIQLEMWKLLQRHCPPGVVVLATGDGAGAIDGEGFIPTLKYLREQGFDIEVMSWEHSLNPCLRSWAESNGRSILLNPFYENLTFVDGGRRATSANALYKKVALHRLN